MGARFLGGSKFGAREQVLGEFGGSCRLQLRCRLSEFTTLCQPQGLLWVWDQRRRCFECGSVPVIGVSFYKEDFRE